MIFVTMTQCLTLLFLSFLFLYCQFNTMFFNPGPQGPALHVLDVIYVCVTSLFIIAV